MSIGTVKACDRLALAEQSCTPLLMLHCSMRSRSAPVSRRCCRAGGPIREPIIPTRVGDISPCPLEEITTMSKPLTVPSFEAVEASVAQATDAVEALGVSCRKAALDGHRPALAMSQDQLAKALTQ